VKSSICTLLVVLAASLAGAQTTYYVATSGSDSYPGTSAQPFRTITYAYSRAVGGDTIIVEPGTYTDYTTGWGIHLGSSGTASSPIVLRSQIRGEAIIDGQNASDRPAGFYITGAYNIVDGFEITRGGTEAGIDIYGGVGNQILNCEIDHNGNDNGGSGIYESETSSGNVFAAVYSHDNGVGRLDHGMYLSGDNDLIYNSICASNGGSGLQIAGYTTVSNMKVYNNVFAWNGTEGIIIWQDMNGVEIKNNVSYANALWGIHFEAATGGGVVIDHNLIYGNGSGDHDPSNNDGGNVSVTFGTSISADPQFVHDTEPGFDAHLTAGSPAVDAGLTLSTVTTDFDGVSRPQGSAYDIGAYELVQSGTTRYVPSQYATIHDAYNACNPGDTVLVANGTYYNEHLYLKKSGTAAAPITLKAANTWGAVIDEQNANGGNGGQVIYLEASYNIIQGFELKNGQQGGITIAPGASAANHNQILQNLIHNNGNVYNGAYGQDGIYSDPNTSDNSYIGNFIRDNGRVSLNSHLDHGMYLSGDNEFVANNLIAANSAYGIQVSGYNTVSNLKIYNNTIVNSYNTSGIMLWMAVSGVDIANNIIYGNATYGVTTSDCHGSGVTIRNNLFYNNPSGTWNMADNGSDVSYTTSGNITSSDPLFVNWWSDWHLQTGSPAINAGLTLSSVTTDFDGVSRPQGGAYDMGAYER
jgi:hypothetical protein